MCGQVPCPMCKGMYTSSMDLIRSQLDTFLRENGVMVDMSTLDKVDSDNKAYVYTFTIHAPTEE